MQSLGQWSGHSTVTVAGQWLDPGRYLLQLALDPARCRGEIGQHGSLPWEVSWKLQLLPTAEAKACPVVPDDSKQKYSQVCHVAGFIEQENNIKKGLRVQPDVTLCNTRHLALH